MTKRARPELYLQPMFVDSHCHLNRYKNPDLIIKRAQEAKISTLLSVCAAYNDFIEIINIVENNSWVYGSIGIHPEETFADSNEALFQWLIGNATHLKVIAIGETGLEITERSVDLSKQKDIFRTHIDAALAADLPLIVHMRNAEAAFFEVMNSYVKRPKGIMHCFTGSQNCAHEVIEWGWKISFSGILTFPNAAELRETAKSLPISSLLLETDAPWLAPQKYRGKQNEPAYITETAAVLANLLNVSLIDIAKQTSDNFFAIFSKAEAAKNFSFAD